MQVLQFRPSGVSIDCDLKIYKPLTLILTLSPTTFKMELKVTSHVLLQINKYRSPASDMWGFLILPKN